jgi:hypothetical protein
MIMTVSKSLTIICRHGGCICFMHQLFWNCLYGSIRSFDADNQEMELKRSRSSKIDIAEYMKTAPDMMDEKR